MFKVPLPELKEKIVATGKVSAEELDTQIKEKINEKLDELLKIPKE